MYTIPTEKITALNDVYGIWQYNGQFRVTYVCKGWLIVWNHRTSPPQRFDCRYDNHDAACEAAVNKLRELQLD